MAARAATLAEAPRSGKITSGLRWLRRHMRGTASQSSGASTNSGAAQSASAMTAPNSPSRPRMAREDPAQYSHLTVNSAEDAYSELVDHRGAHSPTAVRAAAAGAQPGLSSQTQQGGNMALQMQPAVGALRLSQLPTELLLLVLQHLNSDDLQAIMLVNRQLYTVARDRSLWAPVLRRELKADCTQLNPSIVLSRDGYELFCLYKAALRQRRACCYLPEGTRDAAINQLNGLPRGSYLVRYSHASVSWVISAVCARGQIINMKFHRHGVNNDGIALFRMSQNSSRTRTLGEWLKHFSEVGYSSLPILKFPAGTQELPVRHSAFSHFSAEPAIFGYFDPQGNLVECPNEPSSADASYIRMRPTDEQELHDIPSAFKLWAEDAVMHL
eukprot:m.303261 g.303261  ORF g.303261 m.303261 type:complete len:385 (-) comp15781_c0_seq1:151-1305(-)